jgi:hypothetical protein
MEMLGFEEAALHLYSCPKIDSFVVARAGFWRVDGDGFVPLDQVLLLRSGRGDESAQ